LWQGKGKRNSKWEARKNKKKFEITLLGIFPYEQENQKVIQIK
jgi:hypothetical protein